jgi:TM2 domain-containing membrane protein YozV
MKKLLILTLFFAMMAGLSSEIQASEYKLDNQKVDQLFENAQNLDFKLFETSTSALPGAMSIMHMAKQEKDPIVAILLDFFLGGLGIHRFYLGTEVMTGIGYILTCGGIFGIVPLIDFIILIVDFKDISPYIDNPKFFMW